MGEMFTVKDILEQRSTDIIVIIICQIALFTP